MNETLKNYYPAVVLLATLVTGAKAQATEETRYLGFLLSSNIGNLDTTHPLYLGVHGGGWLDPHWTLGGYVTAAHSDNDVTLHLGAELAYHLEAGFYFGLHAGVAKIDHVEYGFGHAVQPIALELGPLAGYEYRFQNSPFSVSGEIQTLWISQRVNSEHYSTSSYEVLPSAGVNYHF